MGDNVKRFYYSEPEMNKQRPVKAFMHPEGNLYVMEIFASVQFEGPLCGTPAVFIRLYGCNLQCPRCDTDYTSNLESLRVYEIQNRILIEYPEYRTVVITGGEPFHQNVTPLANALLAHGFVVQFETNGSLPIPIKNQPNLHIVVSPKTRIHEDAIKKATAIKFIVTKPEKDFNFVLGNISPVELLDKEWLLSTEVFLQPEPGIDNLEFAITEAALRGWKVSIQTHKLLGMR